MTETELSATTQGNGGSPPPDTASQGARDDVAQGAGSELQEKAAEVREKAADVRDTATDEVRNVVGTAQEEARGILGDLGRTVDQEANDQTAKIGQIIDSLSGELEELASNGSGFLSVMAQEAAPRTRSLARWMEQTSPRDMVASVEDLARRQPMLFILGCAAAGVVAGRLTRGLVAAAGDGQSAPPPSDDVEPRPVAGAAGSAGFEADPLARSRSAAPQMASELQPEQVPESGLTTGVRPGEAGLDLGASEPRSEERPQNDRPEDLG